MITDRDFKIAEYLEDLLYRMALDDPEKANMAEVVARMRDNLKKAPRSYRPLNDKDLENNFFLAECDNCGWWGSSALLDGGGAIGMTGDHFDCSCPVCGKVDPAEKAVIKNDHPTYNYVADCDFCNENGEIEIDNEMRPCTICQE